MKRFAFFPGCLIPARYPAMEFAIRETLPTLGIEIVDLPEASCCPDPIYFKSKDKLSWLTIAARNLCLAEELGLELFTNCSGCTATLSETYHLLKENEELKAKVNKRLKKIGKEYKGTSRVRHIVTILRDEVGYENVQAAVTRPLDELKVAIHYGCHVLKPSKIMNVDNPDDPDIMENLVAALGASPVRHNNWYLCCGKACQAEGVPLEMLHTLLGSINDIRAEILCLICPTCYSQFDYGQLKVSKVYDTDYHTPPIYYFQLLAFAMGVPYDNLGFGQQRFKPEVLKKFESAAKAPV